MNNFYIKCNKCGKIKEEKEFWEFKNGEKDCICKKCMSKHINMKSRLKFCEHYDIPYIDKEFDKRVKKIQEEVDKIFLYNEDYQHIYGQYLSLMKLAAYKNFDYSDTKCLNGYIPNDSTFTKEIKKGTEKMDTWIINGRREPVPAVETQVKSSNTEHPHHYNREGALECWDEMEMLFGPEAVMTFCKLNAWKYRYRAADKNGKEDLTKSDIYMNKYKEIQDRLSKVLVKN